MRVYWKLLGAHIHMRVFYHGMMGELVCAEKEFETVKERMKGAEFIPEEYDADETKANATIPPGVAL